MKYIRTKDGRIVKVREGFEDWENSDEYFYKHYHSQADTIEELCDEFVFIDKNKLIEHRCWTHLEWAIANCERNNIDISTIYGAIWTSEGLIYVAKMNENGEFELL